jgi:hypothetical protein
MSKNIIFCQRKGYDIIVREKDIIFLQAKIILYFRNRIEIGFFKRKGHMTFVRVLKRLIHEILTTFL